MDLFLRLLITGWPLSRRDKASRSEENRKLNEDATLLLNKIGDNQCCKLTLGSQYTWLDVRDHSFLVEIALSAERLGCG